MRSARVAALVAALALAPLVGGGAASATTTSILCAQAKTFVTSSLPSLAFPPGTALLVRLARTEKNIELIDRNFARLATAAPNAPSRAAMTNVDRVGRVYIGAIRLVGRAFGPAKARPKDLAAKTRLSRAILGLTAPAKTYESSLRTAFTVLKLVCPHL